MVDVGEMYKNNLNFLTKLSLSLVFFVFVSVLQAGTTGKIKGSVVDKQTGEALPGVNVILKDSYMGASTDVDGFYIILNVPPGKYILETTYIGFSAVTVEIQVSVDLTTTQNFTLSEESLSLDDIVIVAVRPPVEMDRTNSVASMSAEQIDELPVQNLQDLVQLQAGVVIDTKGGVHIRGGRSSEVAYLVDGVPISNQFSSGGGSLIDLESGSIQEVQVISGTFNAEYGQAQSGVINVITKGVQRNFAGSVQIYSGDRVSSNNDIFLGVDKLRPSNIFNVDANFSGPVPGISNMGFYFYGRQSSDDGYLYGKQLAKPEDAWKIAAYETWFARAFKDDPAVQSGTIPIPDSLLTGDGSFVPMSPKERTFLNFKLTYSPSPVINVGYNVFLENETGKIYDDDYRFTPDALKNFETNSQIHILSLNHVLTPEMFYNLSVSQTIRREEQFLYSNIVDPRLQTVSPTRNRFNLGGTKLGKTNIETDKLLVKSDFTWQVDNYNLLKIGGEVVQHRIKIRSLAPQFSESRNTNVYPSDPTLSFDDFFQQSMPAQFVAPQKTTSGETGFNDTGYEHKPIEFSVFAQNTIELDELIVNMGFRYDRFDPDHRSLTNPRVVPGSGSVSLLSATTLKDVEIQSQVSPRFGIAFPISENGVVHVAYGHFFKTPPFEFIFDNSEYKVSGIDGPIVGNANLKPQKTVAYEIGLQQEIFPSVALDVTLFYSDFTNLIGLKIIRQIGNVSSYKQRTNIDNATNQGFTIALEKINDGGLFSGSIDYTYQTGKGSESDPDNIAIIQTAGSSGGAVKDAEKQFVPLNWDQTHTLNSTLATNYEGWTISFIGRLQSGQPYSPTPLRLDVSSKFKNNDNKPVQHSVDMFIRKGFDLGSSMSLSVFLRVYNLYDQANELDVFSVTGRAGRDHRFEVEEKLEEARLVGLFSLQDVDTRQDWFSQPRRIEVGVSVSF